MVVGANCAPSAPAPVASGMQRLHTSPPTASHVTQQSAGERRPSWRRWTTTTEPCGGRTASCTDIHTPPALPSLTWLGGRQPFTTLRLPTSTTRQRHPTNEEAAAGRRGSSTPRRGSRAATTASTGSRTPTTGKSPPRPPRPAAQAGNIFSRGRSAPWPLLSLTSLPTASHAYSASLPSDAVHMSFLLARPTRKTFRALWPGNGKQRASSTDHIFSATDPDDVSTSLARPSTDPTASNALHVTVSSLLPDLSASVFAHVDMSERATIISVHEGVHAPLYVVTSLSTPPWQVLEMALSDLKTESGASVFFRQFEGVAPGTYQYKVRIGEGHWIVDEVKETGKSAPINCLLHAGSSLACIVLSAHAPGRHRPLNSLDGPKRWRRLERPGASRAISPALSACG